jgi:hypothetical protein
MNDEMYMLVEEEADGAAEDELEQLGGVAGIMLAGAVHSRLLRGEQRNPSRLYLTRPQLLPNPRVETPWQQLYTSQSDRAFITTMGFDVATFDSILAAGFGRLWQETPIPRGDVNSAGQPRPWARSLDAEGALGLLLHYLSSTMHEISLQEIFALIPTTVSRYITFGLEILLQVLRSMPDAGIRWPKSADATISEFETLNGLIRERHPLLTGAFASIDGLNLPVQTSDDEDIENATYNGWLSEHFVSSVLVFSPDGK